MVTPLLATKLYIPRLRRDFSAPGAGVRVGLYDPTTMQRPSRPDTGAHYVMVKTPRNQVSD